MLKLVQVLIYILSIYSLSVNAATYIYVGNSQSNSISVFEVINNESISKLKWVEHKTVQPNHLTGPSTPMAYSEKRSMIYFATRHEESALTHLKVSPETGKLSLIASTPIKHSYASIALNNAEDMLLAASYPQNLVQIMSIDVTGNIKPQQLLTHLPHAHAVSFLKDKSSFYISALGNNSVHSFQLSEDKRTFITHGFTQLPPESGPRHLALHPNGKILYVIGELDAHLYALDISTGDTSATIIQRIALLNLSDNKSFKAADVKITKNGRFVYATERNTNNVCGFEVMPNNHHLRKIECIKTEDVPRGIQLEPLNNLLIVAGQKSHHISLYQVLENGTLDLLGRYATEKGPNWIEVVSTHDK